jgi:hypothetical protein
MALNVPVEELSTALKRDRCRPVTIGFGKALCECTCGISANDSNSGSLFIYATTQKRMS